MPANENDNLAAQVAELCADVRHIQADLANIKSDSRGRSYYVLARGFRWL
jgi:hypothetical protein